MTDLEKMKYLRASILAAVGAAAVGAVARGRKAKKDREKAMDVASSSNAIVVPISKKKFLEGLKTPEEQRAEFEGKRKIESDEKPQLAAPTTDLTAPVDVASMKKDILKRRKFDFFGKRASVKTAQHDEKNDGESGDDKKTEVVSEEKIDGRVVLRGQDGKFVSPTDPVAVQNAEKSAGIIDDFKRGLKEHPVALTAGAIGSVMLAAKISDMINERRREKAKSRLDDARERYVALLEGGDGNEKVANDKSDSLSNLGGRVVGTAFLVPLALTAMVTNKIIENRKAEKKRRSEMSDSYPQDPTILYRTYDGDTLKIAADTALMAIMVKRAMIEDAERAQSAFVKSAGPNANNYQMPTSGYSDEDYNNAIRTATDYVGNDDNADEALKMIDAYKNGKEYDARPWYAKMLGAGQIYKDPEFKRRLAQNAGFQDALVRQFGRNKKFIDYKNRQIDDYFSNKWKLQKGGLLHAIMSWLAKNLGFGDWMFNRELKNRLADAGTAKQKVQSDDSVAGNPNQATAQSQPQNQQVSNAGPTYGGFEYLPQNMQDALSESINGGAGSEVGAQEGSDMNGPSVVAEPYSGDSEKGPSPNNADIDNQQYTGSEAPDYASSSVPSAQAAGLQERAPSYGDVSWRTLAQEAQRRSENSPHGLENPGLNELLKLETGRRINPAERPHDNPAWDTIGLASKLMETPRRPNPITPSNPTPIRQPRPELSDKEQADMIDDAIRNPIQPVQSESAPPTPPPVSPTAFQTNARFRPGANEWTNHVESNPPELYNYPVGDYAKSDLGQ